MIPFYKSGQLKDFQKSGNGRYLTPVIEIESSEIPSFSTDWIKRASVLIAQPVYKLYKYNVTDLQHFKTNDQLRENADLVEVIPNDYIVLEAKNINSDTYIRFYTNDSIFRIANFTCGVFEIVIEIGNEIFLESELFSTSLYFTENQADVRCENALIPNVNYNEEPTFSIDIVEEGDSPFDYEINVKFERIQKPYFDEYTFNNIIFNELNELYYEETVTGRIQNETITLDFDTSPIPVPGTYRVLWTSNIPGCSGEMEYEVIKDMFNIISCEFFNDIPGEVGTGQMVNSVFTLTVENTDSVNGHTLNVTIQYSDTFFRVYNIFIPQSASIEISESVNVPYGGISKLFINGDVIALYNNNVI